MAEDARPIETTIDDIVNSTGGDTVRLGEVLDSFQSRSLGAILVIFGLMAGLPVIGAIPGMPDVAAAVVLIAVFHSLVGGQQHFWAPGFIRRREVNGEKVKRTLGWIRPAGQWIDGLVKADRLSVLVDSYMARIVISVSVAFLAVLMFILSLVPFGATPVALGYVLFGLALMSRDGFFALGGYILIAVSVALLFFLWSTIFGSG